MVGDRLIIIRYDDGDQWHLIIKINQATDSKADITLKVGSSDPFCEVANEQKFSTKQ